MTDNHSRRIEAQWVRDDRMTEWDHMRRCGVGFEEMPRVLGISRNAWVATYEFAKATGDKRATGRVDLETVDRLGDMSPAATLRTGVRAGRLNFPGRTR